MESSNSIRCWGSSICPRKWLESGANPREISHAFPHVLGTRYIGNARWRNTLQRAIGVSAEASQYLSMVYIVAVTDSPHSRPFPFFHDRCQVDWSTILRQRPNKGREYP